MHHLTKIADQLRS